MVCGLRNEIVGHILSFITSPVDSYQPAVGREINDIYLGGSDVTMEHYVLSCFEREIILFVLEWPVLKMLSMLVSILPVILRRIIFHCRSCFIRESKIKSLTVTGNKTG